MKKILITGANGFIGSRIRNLLSPHFEIIELDKDTDICDLNSIEKNIHRFSHIDICIHLAAISSPNQCEENKELAIKVNTKAPVEFYKLLRLKFPRIVFIFTSTAHVYAKTDEAAIHTSINENFPTSPISFYGKTKLDAEDLLLKETDTNSKLIILRLFNFVSKHQSPLFFIPSIIAQFEIAKNKDEKEVNLDVGNIDIERDIGHVSDLISAFSYLISNIDNINHGAILNISTGKAKNLKQIILNLENLYLIKANITINPNKVRVEPKSICGDSSAFSKITGWKPLNSTDEKTLTQSIFNEN